MPYILGMDVGGSRTRALVADEEGRALGFGESGPGNHETVGYEGLYGAMAKALEAALPRDVSLRDIAAAGFGVAGFDWESERPATMAAISRLGLSCPLALANDAALGLAAGAAAGWGINIVAGTSNNCYGLSPDGREGRIAGAGAAVGECGGAAEIAARALAAVNHARIRRGPATSLTALLCARAGLPDADALIEAVAEGRVSADAAWAPEVFAAARGGDEAAHGIIAWAGRELGESAAAVIRQLSLEGESFDVVLSGSLFEYEPRLEAGIKPVLFAAAPEARTLHLGAPPVIGALLLGAARACLDARALRARAIETTKALGAR